MGQILRTLLLTPAERHVMLADATSLTMASRNAEPGSKAGIYMQWSVASSFSKRPEACATQTAVGKVSQQVCRRGGRQWV